MAQCIEVLSPKPDAKNSAPGTHLVEEENGQLHVVLWPHYVETMTLESHPHTYTKTNTHTHSLKTKHRKTINQIVDVIFPFDPFISHCVLSPLYWNSPMAPFLTSMVFQMILAYLKIQSYHPQMRWNMQHFNPFTVEFQDFIFC